MTPRTDAALVALSDGAQVRARAGGGRRRPRQRRARGARDRRPALGLRPEGAGLHRRPRAAARRRLDRDPPLRRAVHPGAAARPRRRRTHSAVVWMEAGPRAAALAAMPAAAFEAALNARACGVLGRAAAGEPAPALADRRPGGRPARRPAHRAGRRGGACGAADRGAGAQHEPRATSRRCSTSASRRAPPARDIGAPELLARYHRARHGDMLARSPASTLLNRAAMAGARRCATCAARGSRRCTASRRCAARRCGSASAPPPGRRVSPACEVRGRMDGVAASI